jgi:hypothetical protein
MTHRRLRWLYVVLILVNIPAGLATRWYRSSFPTIVAEYGGDVLAASCIFFGVRFLLIKKPLWQVALWAYLVCILIETAQLYQAPWIVKFRSIPIVAIFLGRGFLWSDWLCYAVGVLIGWGIAVFSEKVFCFSNKKT